MTNYVAGTLAAQQSIQIPVIMKRRGVPLPGGKMGTSLASLGLSARGSSGGSTCSDYTFVLYVYKCELSTGLWQKVGTLINYTGRTCSGPPGGGTDPLVGGGSLPYGGNGLYFNIPCLYCELPGGGGGSGNTPAYAEENSSCMKCILDMIDAAFDCGVPDGGVGGIMTCVAKTKLVNGSIIDYIQCFTPDPTPDWIKCPMSIKEAITSCAGTNVGGRMMNKTGARSAADELNAVFLQIRDDLDFVMHAYELRESWSELYLGDILHNDAWRDLKPLMGSNLTNLDSIRPDKQATILAAMTGYDISPALLQAFFARWNTSLYARSQGVLTPNAQYPDIINWMKVKSYSDSLVDAHNTSIDRGYESIDDMYLKVRADLDRILEEQSKQTVCASVKVQFSQTLTMTREAFDGTLEIFNGHPTDAMDSLSVTIQITDENGVPSNGLFEIQTKEPDQPRRI